MSELSDNSQNTYSSKIAALIKENPSLEIAAKDSINLYKCGSIDVHKKVLVAAVCITSEETLTAKYFVQKFTTMNYSIMDLAEWFKSLGVNDVIMESTGKYWIPVYNILESNGIKPVITHPKYVKQVKGKKTDIRDAVNMANLFRMGYAVPSFIPPAEIRDIRELCRYRLKLTYIRTSEKNRFQNGMTVSQLRLDSVLSDPFGKTATDIMNYLLNEDPANVTDEEILKRVDRRVRKTQEEILESIHGYCFSDLQRLKLNVIHAHIDFINSAITEIDSLLKLYHDKYELQVQILKSMYGISELAALYIIGEIGTDMSVWNNAESLCSWAGLVPANNESAGKKKSTRIGDGGHYIKPLMVQCALSAVKSPYFKYKYEHIKKTAMPNELPPPLSFEGSRLFM